MQTSSDHVKTYINKNINILDVIKNYDLKVRLEGSGRYKMVCPFHSENTASLIVFEDTNSYFCFGCGSGYGVVDFIMNHENISYMEVIRRYSEKIGEAVKDSIKDQIQKKLNDSDKVDVLKYAFESKYRLGIVLRNYLKAHPDKEQLVEGCYKKTIEFFKESQSLSEDNVDYFVDGIIEEVHNAN